MTIQDAHTHFFSRPFFDALARLSPRGGDPDALLAQVAAKTGLQIPDDDTDAHRDRWLAQMDAAGVERMVTFASVPAEADAVAQAAAGSRGRLVPYTLVDPTATGGVDFAGNALARRGFRGLLMFPAMHGYRPDDRVCDPVYELAAEHRAPVLVHCGLLVVKLRDLLGLPRTQDLRLANPLHLVPAANRHPDVTFVVPHFGAGFLRETLLAATQCGNVWVDTSSSNSWIATQPGPVTLADVFRSALAVLGSGRILFGTDSSTFPRGWRGDLAAAQRAALAQAGASEADVAAIFGGNLARLLPA